MLRTYTFFFLLFAGFYTAKGQRIIGRDTFPACGEEKMLAKLLADRPEILARHQAIENQIYYDTKSGHNNHTEKSSVLYVLPIVVHIIENGGPENISDAQVQQGIADMNAAYANIGYYDSGVDIQVQFCLAKRDTSGNLTTGITRTVSTLTNVDMGTQDLDLKNLVRWDPNCYVNIWLVASICNGGQCNIGGYAYLPGAAGTNVDGIVCLASYFGSTDANSVVEVHEMGHYLGLYHTFQGGCLNDDCLADGDYVCDTPPDNSTAYYTCGTYQNTCNTDSLSGFAHDMPDLYEDYMDYGNLNCMDRFTQGQKDRMLWTMENIRTQLPLCPSCENPCSNPSVASFTIPTDNITIGTTVNFTNTSSNANIYSWSVNDSTFSTLTSPSFTFNGLGTFVVQLWADNSDSNCRSIFLDTIYVTCSAVASFSQSAYMVPVGSNVTFTNNSTGATTYAWYVDGVLQGTSLNLSYTFSVAGDHQVYLIASNSLCADTTNLFNFVHVGDSTCSASFTYSPPNPTTCLPVIFTPDTACNYSTYYWSFCDQPSLAIPTDTIYSTTGVGSYVGAGVFLYADQQNNYHVFFGDYDNTTDSTRFYRMDFGNSMKNIPTMHKLYIMGITDIRNHGVSVVYDNGNYYAFFLTNTNLYRAKIGPDITNSNLTVTDLTTTSGVTVGWGHKILIENEGGNYWALIANRDGYITVALIGSNIENNNLTYNTYTGGSNSTYWGMEYVKTNNKDYVFAVDFTNGLKRFDFGTSLGNTPAVTNLGFFGTGLNLDLALYQNCDSSFDGVYFQQTSSDHLMIHLDSVTATPTVTGTIGGTLIASGGISPYVLTDLGLTTFSVQYTNGSIARVSHGGCSISDAFSTEKYPPPVSFTSPGTHYVRLLVDQGLPTQSSYCQTITVDSINTHPLNLGPDTTFCGTGLVVIHAGPWYEHYLWSGGYTDSTYTVYLPGTYRVTVTDYCGRSYTDSVTINSVNPSSPVNLGGDTTVCNGGSVTLNAGAGYVHYVWSNGSTNATLTVNTTGTYWVKATDSCGNVYTDSVQVSSPGTHPLNLGPDTSLCGSISLTLHAGPWYQQYLWSNGSSDSTITVHNGGTYVVTVTDFCGSSITASVIVSTDSAAIRFPTSDTTICGNDSAYICAPGGYTSYSWNNGLSTQCFYSNQAGNYYVTAVDSRGCTAISNHFSLGVYPVSSIAITVSGDTLYCNSGTSRQWYFNGQIINGATSTVLIAHNAGDYTVVITDSSGCNATSNAVDITGINEVTGNADIMVYPNPLEKGNWTLDVNPQLLGNIVQVFDDNGRLVYQTQITAPKSALNFEAARGVYILRIPCNNAWYIQKLVKL